MTTSKPIVQLLREVLGGFGPGPSHRKDIIRLAIETVETQDRQIHSQDAVIKGLRDQIKMWHEIADQRSEEINRLIVQLRKDGHV